MKWEYKTITGVRDNAVDDILEAEGNDGWEALFIGEDEKYFGRTIRFKRQKQE